MFAAGAVVLAAAGVYAVFGTTSQVNEEAKDKKSKSKSSKVDTKKVEALLANFPYLKISKADAEKYVKDYTKHFGKRGKRGGDEFFTKFLLSSDFFLNGAKAENPVTYLALHNPARVPCQNPFARYD